MAIRKKTTVVAMKIRSSIASLLTYLGTLIKGFIASRRHQLDASESLSPFLPSVAKRESRNQLRQAKRSEQTQILE